ncbi:MAG: hypothetical protein Q9184_005382 [Pyrenodesmia sp. 2 TL-2023]
MQCYTELTPPTAVTHSLSLPFLSASANNLVIAKTSLLQIFALKAVLTDTASSTGASTRLRRNSTNTPGSSAVLTGTLQRVDRTPTTKLVLLAQYELSGVVTSLARVKILKSKSGGEALLVSLRNAKVSLVEWDPECYSISKISIHLYEGEKVPRSPWEPDENDNVSYLTVDPRSRCAALKFGARHLAIIPFHQQGDDLVMDDYDPDIDGEKPEPKVSHGKGGEEGKTAEKTPYGPSFVVSMLALDPTLLHPVHVAFLYEYREPTFGVLYSQVASSVSLLPERRDTLSYTVITLDLEQRALTALLSITNLPYDMFAVLPLQLPIGGSLLIGGNELIHVDQAGKTNGVAVNEFAKTSTSFSLADQSDLGFRLEGSLVEQLGHESSELLLILATGELAIIGFKIDGRSVSGMAIRQVSAQDGGSTLLAGPSCASLVGRGRLFVGSEDSDSVVLGWSRRLDKLKRQRPGLGVDAGMEVATPDMSDVEDGIDDDDDDDLYTSAKTEEKPKQAATAVDAFTQSDDYRFRIHDMLENLGPIRSVTLGKPQKPAKDAEGKGDAGPELMTISGRGQAGGLTTFRRQIDPHVVESHSIPNASRLWTVSVTRAPDGLSSEGQPEDLDNYIMASIESDGELRSASYKLTRSGLEEVKDEDFDPDAGATIEAGTLNNGTRIVQVLPTELRTFDADFSLAQIIPLAEEESMETAPKIIHASFADPYVLLVREDESIMLLRADEGGELEEVEQGAGLKRKGFRHGCLYEDSSDVFRLESEVEDEDDAGNVLMFLLTVGGGLQIFGLPNLGQFIYRAEGLSLLPPFLAPEFWRRSQAKEDLTEILVAELGNATYKPPYLILRSGSNDLILYQPYHSSVKGENDATLHFLKIPNPHFTKTSSLPSFYDDEADDSRREPMRAINDLNGYSAVFLPGQAPAFILKSATSPPQLINTREKPIRCLTRLNTSKCQRGFAYIDQKGTINFAQLPMDCQYHTGWVTRKIPFGEDVHALDYHEPTATYVVGVSKQVDFKVPEDETHPEWISDYSLSTGEVVMSIKTMNLEISENTHRRLPLIVVGTALIRGEDLPAQGRIYVFNIIPVVPEPDRPETGHRFKLIAKEEIKGAVTALSEIGTQGFLLAAQGQKCMVRGLKEDGTLLPVAFMDMQCYTSVVKELKGTGLCLMGDAVKGVWLAGYYEDPYQLRLFGKSPSHIEVLAADFLPDGKQLYLVVADANSNIHVLQFDPERKPPFPSPFPFSLPTHCPLPALLLPPTALPENRRANPSLSPPVDPKSLSGHLLLPHTTFHTASLTSSITLLPPPPSHPTSSSTPPSPSQPHLSTHNPPHTLLLTSPTGSLSLLTPLTPSTHRTLSALQSHLSSTLPQPLSLNPREFRHVEGAAAGEGMGMRAGVVDGMVVRRWMEGGRWRWWGEGGGEVGGVGGLRAVVGEGLGVGVGGGLEGLL